MRAMGRRRADLTTGDNYHACAFAELLDLGEWMWEEMTRSVSGSSSRTSLRVSRIWAWS